MQSLRLGRRYQGQASASDLAGQLDATVAAEAQERGRHGRCMGCALGWIGGCFGVFVLLALLGPLGSLLGKLLGSWLFLGLWVGVGALVSALALVAVSQGSIGWGRAALAAGALRGLDLPGDAVVSYTIDLRDAARFGTRGPVEAYGEEAPSAALADRRYRRHRDDWLRLESDARRVDLCEEVWIWRGVTTSGAEGRVDPLCTTWAPRWSLRALVWLVVDGVSLVSHRRSACSLRLVHAHGQRHQELQPAIAPESLEESVRALQAS